MPQKPPPPVINIAVFRRDVYFFAALLLADEQIAGLSGIKTAAEENFDGEVNRLLVLISASARHLLDKSPQISEKPAQKRQTRGNSFTISAKNGEKVAAGIL